MVSSDDVYEFPLFVTLRGLKKRGVCFGVCFFVMLWHEPPSTALVAPGVCPLTALVGSGYCFGVYFLYYGMNPRRRPFGSGDSLDDDPFRAPGIALCLYATFKLLAYSCS